MSQRIGQTILLVMRTNEFIYLGETGIKLTALHLAK
jgi:hypothetical protein